MADSWLIVAAGKTTAERSLRLTNGRRSPVCERPLDFENGRCRQGGSNDGNGSIAVCRS